MQLCCLPSLYSSVSAKSSLGRGMCLRTNREAWWLVYCRMQLNTTWTSWYLCQTALDIQCVGLFSDILNIKMVWIL